jgi:hypothetical protein
VAACGGSTDSTGSSTDNLKGGQAAQHRDDAGKDHDGGMALGNGNGQGAHNGQGTGDGKDCKPADGGPSPCARGDGSDDDGSADDGSDSDGSDSDDGGKDCKPLNGGPSPCSKGKRDH